MFKRTRFWMISGAVIFLITGCATTGRNYQSDIDSLNSRIASLQAQLSEKDQEISKLQNQLGDQQTALSKAESEKHSLLDKLNAETSKQSAAPSKTEESDLK